MDALKEFLQDPLVIPIVSLMVVSVANFVLAIYRSLQTGSFDWHEVPRILDTLVLRKVVPLALLGATVFFVTDETTRTALTAAYMTGAVAALAAEVANLIKLVTSPSPAQPPIPPETPDGGDNNGGG